jgi:hypothetical protein
MLVNLSRTVLLSVLMTAIVWGICFVCHIVLPPYSVLFICFGSWLISSWAVRNHYR